MKDLKTQLIKLGYSNPELRDDLRPGLASLEFDPREMYFATTMLNDAVNKLKEDVLLLNHGNNTRPLTAPGEFVDDHRFIVTLDKLMGAYSPLKSIRKYVLMGNGKMERYILNIFQRKFPNVEIDWSKPLDEYLEMFDRQGLREEAETLRNLIVPRVHKEMAAGSFGVSIQADLADPNMVYVKVGAGWRGEGAKFLKFPYVEAFLEETHMRYDLSAIKKETARLLSKAVKAMR